MSESQLSTEHLVLIDGALGTEIHREKEVLKTVDFAAGLDQTNHSTVARLREHAAKCRERIQQLESLRARLYDVKACGCCCCDCGCGSVCREHAANLKPEPTRLPGPGRKLSPGV